MEPPENNEKPVGMKSRVKFKIMSLKVKGDMDYVAELVNNVILYFLCVIMVIIAKQLSSAFTQEPCALDLTL